MNKELVDLWIKGIKESAKLIEEKAILNGCRFSASIIIDYAEKIEEELKNERMVYHRR